MGVGGGGSGWQQRSGASREQFEWRHSSSKCPCHYSVGCGEVQSMGKERWEGLAGNGGAQGAGRRIRFQEGHFNGLSLMRSFHTEKDC